MPIRDWLSLPRPVAVTFAAVALMSTGVLGLLSWQLLEQDRLLDGPRRRGLVETAADEAVVTMTKALVRLEAIVNGPASGPLPASISLLAITSAGTTLSPGAGLPFVPTRPALREADLSVFSEAAALELAKADAKGALATYRALAGQHDGAVRAGALARLAPLFAKLGDAPAALRAYDELAALDDVAVGGLPASLVASAGRASLLAARSQAGPLREAATTMAVDLTRGRWTLLQSEYDFYVAQAVEWLGGSSPEVDADAVARADAATWLWREHASLPAAGRRLLGLPRGVTLVVWHSSGDRIDAATCGPVFLADLVHGAVPPAFTANLRDLEGRDVYGTRASSGHPATRVASPDGLPWTLQLSSAPSSALPGDSARRRLLVLVLGATVIMVGAGWYFIARGLSREARAARLQNAFVASVSHEFRSPLTSIAHVADLLSQDRLPTDDRRRQAYDILVSDAARLRDMVEHLLDFGRFDAGTVGLRCERVDLGTLMTELVDEARRRVGVDGYTIEFTRPAEPLFAQADRAALGRAVWNLIDNAVKYSPDCHTVWVEVAREGDSVAIAVRDHGLGIPAAEHQAIFQRFVRGAESESRHIRGTGIGLALVRQIVEAHGGEVRLTSDPGRGSRFVLVLHAAGDAA